MQRLKYAHACLRGFAEVVHDGEEFAGQFGDVVDDPKEEEGREGAADEDDRLLKIDA